MSSFKVVYVDGSHNELVAEIPGNHCEYYENAILITSGLNTLASAADYAVNAVFPIDRIVSVVRMKEAPSTT